MNMQRRINTFIVLLGLVVASYGEVPFNGLLLDGEMKPKKGVKVYVKDPKRYAVSDKKGRFGLTDVMPDDTLNLVVSKKETVKVPVGGCKAIKIVLINENDFKTEDDEEMANTGFGFVKRREFTGVSSGISGDRLRSTGKRDVISALKGLVPGLYVSGPAGNESVNIRGINSLTSPTEPLYVVDGIVVSSLDFLNIYDVDHVEVIKDGAQYGSRGANGAIVVTTKTGVSRKK